MNIKALRPSTFSTASTHFGSTPQKELPPRNQIRVFVIEDEYERSIVERVQKLGYTVLNDSERRTLTPLDAAVQLFKLAEKGQIPDVILLDTGLKPSNQSLLLSRDKALLPPYLQKAIDGIGNEICDYSRGQDVPRLLRDLTDYSDKRNRRPGTEWVFLNRIFKLRSVSISDGNMTTKAAEKILRKDDVFKGDALETAITSAYQASKDLGEFKTYQASYGKPGSTPTKARAPRAITLKQEPNQFLLNFLSRMPKSQPSAS